MRRILLSPLALLLLLTAPPLHAALNGSLSGVVSDRDGTPLPGATVTVHSDALLGAARTSSSSQEGAFVFLALPPGAYRVRVELDGYLTVEQPGIEVRLDRTVEVSVELPPGGFEGAVDVSAEVAAQDPTQTAVSHTFSTEYLQRSAVGSRNRSYQTVLAHAAGVAGSADTATADPRVFGSTGSENVYLVDGLDTTDPATGAFGTNFNYDAIQEIAFHQAGFEAEFGRATGGVVNLITRSGGHRFSGSFDLRYQDESFAEAGIAFDPGAQQPRLLRWGATFEGPLQRDRLWFFASAEDLDDRITPLGAVTPQHARGQNYIGKLTWKPGPRLTLVGKAFSAPGEFELAAPAGVGSEARERQEQDNDSGQFQLTGVFDSYLLWELAAGTTRGKLDRVPHSGDLEIPQLADVGFEVILGNSLSASFAERERNEAGSSLSYFLDTFHGSHTFKGGLEHHALQLRDRHVYTGRGFSFTLNFGQPVAMLFQDSPGELEFDGEVSGAYLQDSWQLLDNLTLKAGVRWDKVRYDDDLGTEVVDMDQLQPRLGLAWDVQRDGRTLARISWGRFTHPASLTLASQARTRPDSVTPFTSCSSFERLTGSALICTEATALGLTVTDPFGVDPAGWLPESSAQIFGFIDPGLEPTFVDELTLSLERQVMDRSTIRISYIDKITENVIENTCGVPKGGCSVLFYGNLGPAERRYEALLAQADLRFRDRLLMLASYTYSKSRGTVEAEQYNGAEFEFDPEYFQNVAGFLSDDRRHRVKLNGHVLLPRDFTLAFGAFWSSAFAWTEGGLFASPRGNRRANENYQLDLQLSKSFRWGRSRLELIGSVYNVLDTQQPTSVCEKAQDCGIEGAPLSWQTPRQVELGLRIEL